MHQIYYDTETTGSSTAFDSITEIYLGLNDENFQEFENLHLRCRLKEGVIPNLNALLITKTTTDQLKEITYPMHSQYTKFIQNSNLVSSLLFRLWIDKF